MRPAHSPGRGNCIFEADPCVAQAIDDELRSADRVISRPRALHILARGLDADPQDPRDFPIGLADGNEAKALQLAAAEMRPLRWAGKKMDPARRTERVGADELCAAEPPEGKRSRPAHSERTGCARLARHSKAERAEGRGCLRLKASTGNVRSALAARCSSTRMSSLAARAVRGLASTRPAAQAGGAPGRPKSGVPSGFQPIGWIRGARRGVHFQPGPPLAW